MVKNSLEATTKITFKMLSNEPIVNQFIIYTQQMLIIQRKSSVFCFYHTPHLFWHNDCASFMLVPGCCTFI